MKQLPKRNGFSNPGVQIHVLLGEGHIVPHPVTERGNDSRKPCFRADACAEH